MAISTETYNKVYERDEGCILCKTLGIHEKIITTRIMPPLECHHYINKSRLGMGIEENLVILCKYHHIEETRYRDAIKEYLQGQYIDWNEEKLKFRKWE